MGTAIKHPVPLIRAILDYAARYKFFICICMYVTVGGLMIVGGLLALCVVQ